MSAACGHLQKWNVFVGWAKRSVPTNFDACTRWWARRRVAPLPTLVIAQSIIVGLFRKEWPAATAPAAGRWRSDRAHPEQFLASPARAAGTPLIGTGRVPEQP